MNFRITFIVLVLFISAGLSACGNPAIEATPTPGILDQASPTPDSAAESSPTPQPSPVIPTLQTTSTPTSTQEATPTPEPSPTSDATLEITSTPTPGPNASDIQIYAPGPLSQVSSPIFLRAFLSPYAVGDTRVELFGEDGRLLSRDAFKTGIEQPQYVGFTRDITFEIPGAGELGRLQVSTVDADGRLRALNSVHVMLLSEGGSIINQPGNLEEAVLLDLPLIRAQAKNGEVLVRGRIQSLTDEPVLAELVGETGSSLSTRVLPLFPADGEYHDFEITIPYKVGKFTPALLVIRQNDDRIPGPFYLYSQEIYLNP